MSDPTAATAVDTRDRGPEFVAVAVSLTVFASIFVVARLWTRIFRTKAFGWDDGFIIVAWAATIATTSLGVASTTNGYGRSIMTIPPAQIPEAMKFSNFGILTNGVAMGTMKMSIGFSMLRIQLARTFTIVVWFTMALSVLVNLNVLVGCFKSCTPMEKIWNMSIPGTCWPTQVNVSLAYLQSSGNILTDLLLTFGLLVCLTKLKLSMYNRWALRGVFLIGLVATISGIVKITKLPDLMKTTNPTLDGVELSIWVSVEMNCGLWAASLPPLKASFEGILSRWFGVHIGTGTGTSRYGTNQKYAKYGSRHSRASRIPEPDVFDGSAESKTTGNSTFVLETIRPKAASEDGISVESDQRQILRDGGSPGQGGHGQFHITKTVDYTVSDEELGHGRK
ncbi:phosphatidylserine decarboxylase [Diplodia corticola]|uniref:Phosphatidylserine decarboxylase n=1 Tax=Diplodia corticola TaxID=236234 RepID=A0A1J9QWA0_9PEZI|nr:phosphatidylserine decarboxylase [Diplodia corticola]OJD32282.1 phosphatidylserine decarboxylase [Diplodia corticola]